MVEAERLWMTRSVRRVSYLVAVLTRWKSDRTVLDSAWQRKVTGVFDDVVALMMTMRRRIGCVWVGSR